MKNVTKLLLVFLSVATGALFIYSAYTKAFPIHPFEYTIVEFLHFPLIVAAVAARLFIGLELAIGVLMIAHLFGKNKWVLKCSALLLIMFSFYLIFIWAKYGNDVNCGCFGDAVWMDPATSLIKNAVLLIIIVILILFHRGLKWKWAGNTMFVVAVSAIVLPFILFWMPLDTPDHLDLKPLYAAGKTDIPAIDLTKGKYVIAFLSPGCSHCKKTALKMHEMKAHYPQLPLFMIIGGTTSDLTDFWKETKAQNVPFTRLDKDNFLRYTGGVFPLVLWINNGKVVARVSYRDMTAESVKKLIAN